MVKFHTKHKIGENIGRRCETISGTGQRTKAPPAESATRSTHKLKKSAVFFRPALIAGIAILTGSIAHAQVFNFANPIDSNWQTVGNWGAAAPGFNTTLSEVRLQLNGGATPLNYTAAEGSTIIDVSQVVAGQPVVINRAIVIGGPVNTASGTLNISGGTLATIRQGTEAPVLIGAGTDGGWSGTAALNVTGGMLDVGNGEIAIMGRGTNTSSASMTISGAGVVNADLVSFAALGTTQGTGTLSIVNGGTLRVRSILDRNVADNTTLNIDGGTIVALDTTNNVEWIRDDNGGVAVNILTNGATFDTNGHDGQQITATMAGNGSITKIGAGTLILAANNTYTGITNVSAGTLQIGAGGTTGRIGTAGLNLAAGTTLAVSRSDAQIQSTFTDGGIAAGLGGNVNFETKGGATAVNAFTLDIANTFTGTATVRANGHLRVTHTNALGSTSTGTIVLGSGSGQEADGNGSSLQLAGGITVTGEALTISGSGGNPADAQAPGTLFRQQRGALQSWSGDNTWAGPITIAGDNTRIGIQNDASLTVSGPITDGGLGYAVIFRGASDAAGMITISSTGNSWGHTKIFGSTTRIGATNALPTTALLSVGTNGVGATIFDLNGFNQRVAGLSQINNTAGTITNNGSANSTLTVDSLSDQTFSGSLTDGIGTVSLVKEGAFTQTLTAMSTYTGTTTVNSGTLLVTGSLTGSATAVNNGGTFGGTGTVAAVTVNAGGNFSPGLPNQIGFLSTNNLTLASNATFTLEIDTNAQSADFVNISGDFTLAIGTAPSLFVTDLNSVELPLGTTLPIASYTGIWNNGLFTVNGVPIVDDIGSFALGLNKFAIDYNFQGNTVALVVVPEPSTAALAFGAFAGILGLRRRRRSLSR